MKKLVLVCALPLCSASVLADEVGQSYINPQVGYLITDSDRVRDNNWLYGLSVGSHLSEHFSLEVAANRNRFHRDNAPSLELTGLSIDGLIYFTRARVAPYMLLGAGVISDALKPNGGTERSLMAEGGFGLRALLWENADKSKSFSLRPEVKARYDDIDGGHYTDYIGSLGFQFGFGPAPVVAAAPTPPPAAAPAPPPPPAPPPAPLPPADSDSDGVTDDRDRCPDTAQGVMVDTAGCEQKGSVTLEGITFELNSATLTAASKPVLDVTAVDLKKHPRVRIEIQGHTDSTGADAYNLKLSQRRAEAVRDYLIQQGVPENQLSAKGYGETQPTADNKTEAGRSQNRRVVMNVLENPRDIPVRGEGTAEKTTP